MMLPRNAAPGSSPSGSSGSRPRISRAKIAYGLAIHVSTRDTENLRGRKSTGGRGFGGVGLRHVLYAIARARPAEPRRVGREPVRQPDSCQQSVEPHQPARRHGRHAVDLERTREHDALGAEERREIVSGVADLLLRRRQTQRLAHRAVEPGTGVSGLRPRAVVERAEDHHVGLLQARLERTPDEQPRMHRNARTHVLADQQRAIEIGIIERSKSQAASSPARTARRRKRARLLPASPCQSGDAMVLQPASIGSGRALGQSGNCLGAPHVGIGEVAEQALVGRSVDSRFERREGRRKPPHEIARAVPIVVPKPAHRANAESCRSPAWRRVRRARAPRRRRPDHRPDRARGRQRSPAPAPARRTAKGSSPSRVSGCFNSAISSAGANFLAAASTTRSRNAPGTVLRKGRPALSSTRMPQVSRRIATRRASSRSGETSAAVRPGVSAASRRMSAMASASSCAVGASISVKPSSASTGRLCRALRPQTRPSALSCSTAAWLRCDSTRSAASGAATSSAPCKHCDISRA